MREEPGSCISGLGTESDYARRRNTSPHADKESKNGVKGENTTEDETAHYSGDKLVEIRSNCDGRGCSKLAQKTRG